MGEIRVKSENLFDLEGYITKAAYIHNIEITSISNGMSIIATSSDDPYINPSYNTVGQQITASAVRRAVINCKPNTAYTLSLHQSQNVTKGISYFNSEFTVVKGYDSFNGSIFNMITPEDCTYILLRIGDSATLSEGTTVELTDIQLLEGTYTSETIPEYQPYFLNRPAHRCTNGQWVDIPTHHFINGRWQGELTSQSPLKFRADGEMLDWRVEGRTSGNLFDIKHFVDTAYCHNVVLTQLNNGIRIQATSSNDPYANYVIGVIGQALPVNMRNAVIPCKSNIDYTFRCAQSSRIGKYISYFDKDYKVVKNYTPFSGTPINFKTPETCVYILLRIGDSSTLSEGTTIELTDIQILEGTYAADTLPSYEPYGGVGDWDETEQKYRIPVTVNGVTTNLYTDHQLMDGDSIDFTTTETTIPLATGNNTLMIDTAVQPKSVFVKFEG